MTNDKHRRCVTNGFFNLSFVICHLSLRTSLKRVRMRLPDEE